VRVSKEFWEIGLRILKLEINFNSRWVNEGFSGQQKLIFV
jgi:hypothetical protein